MVDTKTDTWTVSWLHCDDPIDTCDRDSMRSCINKEIPFQRTKRKDWFEIKKSKSKDLHFQKSLQKRRKKNKIKKTHRSK